MRIASCQCRGFRVVVEAEPDIVGICHCQFCQRRTGVPLTCNAYFPKAKVRLEGEHRIYTRDCPERRKLHNHFCPACGSAHDGTHLTQDPLNPNEALCDAARASRQLQRDFYDIRVRSFIPTGAPRLSQQCVRRTRASSGTSPV